MRRSGIRFPRHGGVHNAPAVYEEARIDERAKVVGWAIDARRRRFPDETPFAYPPHAAQTFAWNDSARATIKDYNLLDLGI